MSHIADDGPVAPDDDNDPPTGPIPRFDAVAGIEQAGPFAAGSVIADGRFRLLTLQGRHRELQFWQAFDLAVGQVVALTLVDPEETLPIDRVNEVLSLTVRQRGLSMPGIAAVREVFHTGRFGVVVSEWVAGGSLRQIADTNPSPLGVAAALQSLAVAAEAAHRAELTLSIDHPARVRVSTEGNAVLAFPGTTPETTQRDDLRGIGGAFYALLVDRWPPQDPMPAGWTALETDGDGRAVEPVTLDPSIPFLISAAAAGLIRERGGIFSATTLMTLLRQARADIEAGGPEALPTPAPPMSGYAGFGNFGPEQQADAARRGLVRITLAAAAAVLVLAVVLVTSSMTNLLDTDDTPSLDADRLGLNATTDAEAPPAPPSPTVRAAGAGTPVDVVEATVFSPDGSPDNPNDAGRAVDGDTSTGWVTDTYRDAVPFPTFKEGLGLAVKLRQPTILSAVILDLPSSGTVVQMRSAKTDSPKSLADTTELTPPVPVQPGENRIPVPTAAATSTLVVWISTLGSKDGQSRGAINEVRPIGSAAPPA